MFGFAVFFVVWERMGTFVGFEFGLCCVVVLGGIGVVMVGGDLVWVVVVLFVIVCVEVFVVVGLIVWFFGVFKFCLLGF